jgi:hypothetical protein
VWKTRKAANVFGEKTLLLTNCREDGMAVLQCVPGGNHGCRCGGGGPTAGICHPPQKFGGKKLNKINKNNNNSEQIRKYTKNYF